MVEHLEESGFDPVIDEDELTVDLTPCLHAVGEPISGARCSVHLTMIQSVLTAAGGPLAVEGMRPVCDPNDCVIQLMRREPEA